MKYCVFSVLTVLFVIPTLADSSKFSSFRLDGDYNTDYICKVIDENETEQDCLPLVREASGDHMREIELVEKANSLRNTRDESHEFYNNPLRAQILANPAEVRSKWGGAIALLKPYANRSPEDYLLRHISENYEYIRIKHFAAELESNNEGSSVYRFFANVLWRSAHVFSVPNGTLSIEGAFEIPQEGPARKFALGLLKGAPTDLVAFSDSLDKSLWERKARLAHFKATYGIDTDVDEKTQEMLEEIVIPALIYEYLLVLQAEQGGSVEARELQ